VHFGLKYGLHTIWQPFGGGNLSFFVRSPEKMPGMNSGTGVTLGYREQHRFDSTTYNQTDPLGGIGGRAGGAQPPNDGVGGTMHSGPPQL